MNVVQKKSFFVCFLICLRAKTEWSDVWHCPRLGKLQTMCKFMLPSIFMIRGAIFGEELCRRVARYFATCDRKVISRGLESGEKRFSVMPYDIKSKHHHRLLTLYHEAFRSRCCWRELHVISIVIEAGGHRWLLVHGFLARFSRFSHLSCNLLANENHSHSLL